MINANIVNRTLGQSQLLSAYEHIKEKVHPVISSSENGIVSIRYDNITVPDIVLTGCDIPFIRDGMQK